MGAVVSLNGTLLAGLSKASCATFPAGLINMAFQLRPPNKNAMVGSYQTPNVNSPSSFVTLDGVGPAKSVTQATFFFARTSAPMQLRLSFDDGSGGTTTAVVNADGLCIIEPPGPKFIKLVEAQGVGTVEYYASGNL